MNRWKTFTLSALFLICATNAPAQTAASVTLERIASQGAVKVGYVPAPGTFAFETPQGQTVGYSIDLCQRVVDNVRKSLKRPDLKIVYVPLKASQRIPMLKSGDIDMECGTSTNTLARQQEVDFSHTFFNAGVRLLTLKTFTVDNNAALWKKRIAVTKGTTAEALVMRLKTEQNLELLYVDSNEAGLESVEKGAADGYAQDDILLYGLIGESKLKDKLTVTGRFLSVEPYALMLPKGDVPFREVVDKTMLALMSSGEMLQIYNKWFNTDKLRVPMNNYMKDNLRFPNKYGIPG